MEDLAKEFFEAHAELERAEKFSERVNEWKGKAKNRLSEAEAQLKKAMEIEKAYKFKSWDGDWILISSFGEYEEEVTAYKLD